MVHGFLKMSTSNKQASESALCTACEANKGNNEPRDRSSTSLSFTKMISEAFDVAKQAFQMRKHDSHNTMMLLLTDAKDTHQTSSSHQKMIMQCKELSALCSQVFVFATPAPNMPLLQVVFFHCATFSQVVTCLSFFSRK